MSDGQPTSKERVEAIKECELMARGLAETLTCRGDTGHYCPNCGNGLHNARVFAEALAKKIAALGVPAHEPCPIQGPHICDRGAHVNPAPHAAAPAVAVNMFETVGAGQPPRAVPIRFEVPGTDLPELKARAYSGDEVIVNSRELLDIIQSLADRTAVTCLRCGDEAVSAPPPGAEPPYRVRDFWSPCRKYIATACVSADDISLVDDDGKIWEPAGPEQDMAKQPTATKGGE